MAPPSPGAPAPAAQPGPAYPGDRLQAPGAGAWRLKPCGAAAASGPGPGLRRDRSVALDNGTKVRPGTRLVREWRGRTHVVTATESGFDYDGEAYGSLSAIAQRITGAHWSGPRFFGLRPSGESASAAEHG